MSRKISKPNQVRISRIQRQPPHYSQYLSMCSQLSRLRLRGLLQDITRRIQFFYIQRFPAYQKQIRNYQPLTYYEKVSQQTTFHTLPILYSTFYIMTQVSNKAKIKANRKKTSIKQFLLFNRQILAQYVQYFVRIRQVETTKLRFQQWLQQIYYNAQDIPVVLMYPWELEIRGIMRKMTERAYGVSLMAQVREPQDFGKIASLIFQQQQLTEIKRDQRQLKDSLDKQKIQKYVKIMQRHSQWRKISKILQSIKIDLRNLLFFVRDYIFSCITLNYRGAIKTATQINTAFFVSFSAQSKFTRQTSFIWVNVPAFFVFQCKSQQQLDRVCMAILFTFLHKLVMHSNFYNYQLQVDDQQQVLVKLRANCGMKTRVMLSKQYFQDPQNIAYFSDFQRMVFYTGASKQFDDSQKIFVKGSFYLYNNPEQDCFKQLVDNLVRINLLSLSEQQARRAAELKDPFSLSQLCNLPIVCSASRQFSNVSTIPVKPNQKLDENKFYCILISLGHAQLGKIVPKKAQKMSQFIWEPLRIQVKDVPKKVQQQKQIVEQYQEQLKRQLISSGEIQLINKFSFKYLPGTGFMDIQTLTINNQIQKHHNIIYLACIVFWCPWQKIFREQTFSWFDYHQQLPIKLVKRMLQIAYKFNEQNGRQASYIWQTFNGIHFDYYILKQYFMNSLLCMGSFGQRSTSKGFYTNQVKFFDVRTIYNRGTLKQLTKNQHYAKKDLKITAIKTFQDYKKHRKQIDKYCLYDCRSLMQLVHSHYSMFMQVLIKMYQKFKVPNVYYDFLYNPRNILASFTASSQSMYLLRYIFFPFGLQRFSPLQSIQKHRKYIFGGMVQVFRHFNYCRSLIYQLDVVGMYSAIMMKPLPYVQIFRQPFNRFTNNQLRILRINLDEIFQQQRKTGDIFMFVLNNIELLTEYPCIPVRLQNGGLIYPKQIKHCLVTAQQLQYFLDNDLIKYLGQQNIQQIIRYRTKLHPQQSPQKQPIKRCVQQLVELRKGYKAKMKQQPGNPQHALKSDFCKLQINSISGKFMMRFFPSTLLAHTDYNIHRRQQYSDNDLQRQRYFQRDQQQKIGPDLKVIYDYSRANQPYIGDLLHIGAYITSQGRFQIFKAIHALQKKGLPVYYTDTDSVFVSKQSLNHLNQLGLVGQKFGDLQSKNVGFDYATLINRKCYILLKKLPQQFQSKTLEQFSKFTQEQQQQFIVKNYRYQFTQQQRDKFYKLSPMTTYIVKNYAKIGFKGFSIIPHWTQLVAIQYSFIVTHQVARFLHLMPHTQNSLPILNRKYLQILLDKKDLRCNKIFEYQQMLKDAAQGYCKMNIGLTIPEKKTLSFQKTFMVTKRAEYDSVNFMETFKVLNLNAKRKITQENYKTEAYQSKQEFQK